MLAAHMHSRPKKYMSVHAHIYNVHNEVCTVCFIRWLHWGCVPASEAVVTNCWEKESVQPTEQTNCQITQSSKFVCFSSLWTLIHVYTCISA